MYITSIGNRFFGAAHIRLGNNFQQGCSRAIKINASSTRKQIMYRLSRILFQVRPGDADGFFAITDGHGHLPFADNRQSHL